jgi:hypothetical protein
MARSRLSNRRRRIFHPPESHIKVVSLYYQEQEFPRPGSATPAA